MDRNLAVLIDFENICCGAEKEGLGRLNINILMDRFKEKGRILVARSYADWGRFARFKQGMMMEGISLFELSAHGLGSKNRADIALVVDCMELAYSKNYVDTFVVISGDSDFTPLVMKLKELNKRVIGCGTRGSTSRLIVEACDEFIFYDTLLKERATKRPRRMVGPTNRGGSSRASDLLVSTLRGLQRENERPVHSSLLKAAMLRKDPSFSESDLGHPTLGRFLEACRNKGDICLTRDEQAGGYLVDIPDGGEVRVSPELHEYKGRQLELYEALRESGLEPLTPSLRQTICRAVVEDVENRNRRNRRSTVQWVVQDVVKQLRNDEPLLAPRHVRSVFRALQNSGAVLHPDGEPIRSPVAPFVLKGDSESLESALEAEYVRCLQESGVDVQAEAGEVSQLITGDRDQARIQSYLAESVEDEAA